MTKHLFSTLLSSLLLNDKNHARTNIYGTDGHREMDVTSRQRPRPDWNLKSWSRRPRRRGRFVNYRNCNEADMPAIGYVGGCFSVCSKNGECVTGRGRSRGARGKMCVLVTTLFHIPCGYNWFWIAQSTNYKLKFCWNLKCFKVLVEFGIRTRHGLFG